MPGLKNLLITLLITISINSIDLGGEFAGEMYLKGEVERELSLIGVEQSGIDRTIDKSTGTIVTK
ncbi:MAG: hypothetical protein QNJ41_00660 [Xenococcaceae cyanobacterium MO_188.B32]|nr:hypothetical protein [Xenococcaceae cyanobacterium MO_188.B32]